MAMLKGTMLVGAAGSGSQREAAGVPGIWPSSYMLAATARRVANEMYDRESRPELVVCEIGKYLHELMIGLGIQAVTTGVAQDGG